jgi:hypothetical protein
MLNFIKKIFGGKPAETSAPYKVETPVVTTVEAKPAAKAKKPAVKKTTARKPRAPKA